jgi:hypothetical protein
MDKSFPLYGGDTGYAPDAKQDYSKGSMDMGDSKVEKSGPMDMIKAGGSSTSGKSPTGSSQSYPKGSSVNMGLASKFNPMNDGMPTYGIGGVSMPGDK